MRGVLISVRYCILCTYICTHTYTYTVVVRIIGILGIYMIKRGCENESALLILLIIIKKIHQNQTFHWIIRIVNGGGGYHYEIDVFLKYTLDTIIGTPRNS